MRRADAVHCVRTIDSGQAACTVLRERNDMAKATDATLPPALRRGAVQPSNFGDFKTRLTRALAPVVHPEDLAKAVKRVLAEKPMRAGSLAAKQGKTSVIREHRPECGGQSILGMFWDELDTIMERLMAGDGAEADGDKDRAYQLAWCIAVTENPYHINVDRVRREAVARWEAKYGEDD